MKGSKGQIKAILDHLKKHKTLTSAEAFKLYGCTRLSAKIFDLRKDGYVIETHKKSGKTRFGTYCEYGEYELKEDINE